MEIKASILDYLGKFEDGIMVLVALTCDGEYYEGVFFYNADSIVFNADERIEEKLGKKIEEWDGYVELLKGILKNIVPYKEMINRIDEVDFSEYLEAKDDFSDEEPEYINSDDVTFATMSSDTTLES